MKKFYTLTFFQLIYIVFAQPVKYTHIENYSSENHSIHVIEVDPSAYEIQPVKALDNGIGRESVLSISTRYGAVASVNGSFFSIGGTYDGKASGALKIHDWYSLPVKPRGCIGWSLDNQSPRLDRLLIQAIGTYEMCDLVFDGLNRPRKNGEIILFTPSFHKTTLTNPDGEEVVVVDGVIQSIVKKGSTKIPENGFVLSIQEKNPLFNTFSVGARLTISTQITPLSGVTPSTNWNSLDYIVGGTPILLYQGNKVTNFECEQTLPTFLSKRHARTAVGILPNGNWIFVVVDKAASVDGMTIYELTDLMAELGCTDALNLDGGGSSTMVYKGAIQNSPHGEEPEGPNHTTRRVSDAIVILKKEQ